VLPECSVAATTKVRQQPSPKLRKTLMAAPLRVLLVFSVAATTKVEGDVTSMAGPPGGAGRSPKVATTEVEENLDGGPLGVLPVFLAAATTEVEEDVMSMAGPLGGVVGISSSSHN
jgi:hypothetical protein